MRHDTFTEQTVDAIGQAAYRETPGPRVPLDETSASLSLLTVDALARLMAFLRDLAKRPPMTGPVWIAHREVIEALAADIERHHRLLYYDELHGEVPK